MSTRVGLDGEMINKLRLTEDFQLSSYAPQDAYRPYMLDDLRGLGVYQLNIMLLNRDAPITSGRGYVVSAPIGRLAGMRISSWSLYSFTKTTIAYNVHIEVIPMSGTPRYSSIASMGGNSNGEQSGLLSNTRPLDGSELISVNVNPEGVPGDLGKGLYVILNFSYPK